MIRTESSRSIVAHYFALWYTIDMLNVVAGASCQSPIESPIEPNTLHFVSDDELLFRTRELARHETELTIVTIQHLDEIERRGLYDTRGYPSLFEYAVRELHYSKGCAWRRIMVMKLCRAVPGIADKLRSGELNLTTASQLQNAIEKRARKAARKAAAERASESASVPPAGAVIAGAEEPVSGEVQPARTGVAGASAAVPPPAGVAPTGVGAAALGAVWAPVGAAATQGTVGGLGGGRFGGWRVGCRLGVGGCCAAAGGGGRHGSRGVCTVGTGAGRDRGSRACRSDAERAWPGAG